MEIEHIRDLIGLMKENDLTEVRIIEGDTRLLLKRGKDVSEIPMVAAPIAPVQQMAQAAMPAQASAAPVAAMESGVTIDSPMVGTFYTAPAPDVDVYVRVGDHVNPDTVVCIVEAMKVMNEIKAEVSGTIEKILVQNAQAVEFGQPMFRIKSD
jgi:acetyl-CoA carboxylase biotin carboxyl carrier protein